VNENGNAARLQARLDAANIMRPGRNYIYFIEAEGLRRIKIGQTDELQVRFRDLSCSSPVPLTVLLVLQAGGVTEAQLHRKFHADRVHGEWFNASDDLRDYIAAHIIDMALPACFRNPHLEGPWHPLNSQRRLRATA
jgi:hypothetical protein